MKSSRELQRPEWVFSSKVENKEKEKIHSFLAWYGTSKVIATGIVSERQKKKSREKDIVEITTCIMASMGARMSGRETEQGPYLSASQGR